LLEQPYITTLSAKEKNQNCQPSLIMAETHPAPTTINKQTHMATNTTSLSKKSTTQQQAHIFRKKILYKQMLKINGYRNSIKMILDDGYASL
jgi:hypothetical protein